MSSLLLTNGCTTDAHHFWISNQYVFVINLKKNLELHFMASLTQQNVQAKMVDYILFIILIKKQTYK